MKIEERVIDIIASAFNVDKNGIKITDTKEDIESWDSIGHLQLIMGLEANFGIKINTEDIVNIDSVGKCIEIVTNQITE